tara:strand:+ start:158 stop:340 length:183 start_codon:yes stop_codon:yes gene_type:complete
MAFFLNLVFPIFFVDELIFFALFIILDISEQMFLNANLLEKYLLYRPLSDNFTPKKAFHM